MVDTGAMLTKDTIVPNSALNILRIEGIKSIICSLSTKNILRIFTTKNLMYAGNDHTH